MPRTIVVLPTPGPPVITATLAVSAVVTASACWRASAMPASFSYQASARASSIASLGRRRGEQPAQPRRQRALGPIQARLVDGGRARVLDDRRVQRDVARLREPVDGRVGRLLGQVEQRRRLLRQPRPRHEHVAVAALLVEHVAHARLGARGRVARHAQRRRQLVRRQEADAPHVEGEPVRVLAHARDRRGAVAACRCAPRTRARRRSPAGTPSPCAPRAARSRPCGWRARATARCPAPR